MLGSIDQGWTGLNWPVMIKGLSKSKAILGLHHLQTQVDPKINLTLRSRSLDMAQSRLSWGTKLKLNEIGELNGRDILIFSGNMH